jgi:hypothetical protein
MSYDNTKCPCGGTKQTETMLCPECCAAFWNRHEMTDYQNGALSVQVRRQAAITLLAMARGRKRRMVA